MDRNVKVSEIILVLESHGFKKLKNKKNGHGDVYAHSDGRRTTISKHSKNGTLSIKTLSAIQKQTGINF